jgi:hypothetical protein
MHPSFQASAAMFMRSALLWDITHHRFVILYRRFGTTNRSLLQAARSPRRKAIKRGCTNPGGQVAVATIFCRAVPNTCGSSAWNLLPLTLLVPTVFRWILDSWKICAPLQSTIFFLLLLPCTPAVRLKDFFAFLSTLREMTRWKATSYQGTEFAIHYSLYHLIIPLHNRSNLQRIYTSNK